MKLDILAIGSHPDDIELGCGGTLAKESYAGKKVGVIDLTEGELGTRGSAQIRAKEASQASKILKLSIRRQMGFSDGFFKNDKEHQMALVEVIRSYQPDIILCNPLEDRHPDHGKAGKLVSDVCFLSGLSKIETGQKAWRPKALYHYIQWKYISPDIVVDISDVIDIKMKAVLSYSTQFYNPKSQEPKTPISSKNFIDSVSYRSRDLGRIVGVEHAEGFTVERFATVDRITDLK